MVPTTICHVISAGAGSSTVVTSFKEATTLVLLLLLLVPSFLAPTLQHFLTLNEQLCVTVFLVFSVVKESTEQEENTAASMANNEPGFRVSAHNTQPLLTTTTWAFSAHRFPPPQIICVAHVSDIVVD